jgi:phosphoglycolate phosphatase-like HAD superfamily hydrolase
VGDSVDDMRAAAVAGLRPVGLAGTLTATILLEAGAEVVLDSPERIEEAFPAQ